MAYIYYLVTSTLLMDASILQVDVRILMGNFTRAFVYANISSYNGRPAKNVVSNK